MFLYEGGGQSFKGIRVFSEVLYKNIHTYIYNNKTIEETKTDKHYWETRVEKNKKKKKWLNNSVAPHIYSYR